MLGGLARAGHRDAALGLADGLLSAAEAFDYRMPELYGGDDRALVNRPVPYPAACRPQAWAAAGAVLLLQAAPLPPAPCPLPPAPRDHEVVVIRRGAPWR
ncbi:hypothetical protein [Micromonospora sp. DH14]|uniref:hypothetical protein n=1 Tax=Micromonospora sp. DH14 TaxID=3040120 RepID=UPI002441EDFD|nr:hypothetical protein [Micromonospora sp. DH14]MDG9675055.1 hypothetical protein [Micromonospora sp. DH14]